MYVFGSFFPPNSTLSPSHKHFFPPSLCTKTSHGHKPAKLNQVTSLLEISDRLFSLVMASLCHFFVRPPLQTAICYHSTVITAGHALAYGALPQRKCNEDLFCYFGSFHISKYATESMLNSTPLPIIIMLPSSFQTFQTHNYSVSKAPTSEFRLTIM